MAVFEVRKGVELRPVPGYGGKYSVGDDGSVWREGSELAILSGMYVNLSWHSKVDKVRVAYLVARAFVPNSEMREFVRHKNGDLKDNRAENLEWSDKKEERRGRRAIAEPVSAWSKDSGRLVGSWGSVRDAARALGMREESIRRVLRGAGKSSNGMIFK